MSAAKTITVALCLVALSAHAAEIHAPAKVVAGNGVSIASNGSGDGTLYLVGPAIATKRKVQAGNNVQIDSQEIQRAGAYTATLCSSDGCGSTNFTVTAAAPNRLSFLVHPSRAPVDSPNRISAVAFVQDNFRNLVLKPAPVKFSILPKDGKEVSVMRDSENGVAWVRLSSAKKEGATRLAAEIGHANEVRVVQQVAADACNLRIKSNRSKAGYLIETDPVRDCSGNSVPDGTVVSFTKTDQAGKTTVDVPIKRGVARVEMPVQGRATVTVASGVVTGNELLIAGGQ